VKALGHVDGLLAGHRVGYQQHLDRPRLTLDGFQFAHHVFVNLQPSGGVQNDNVISAFFGRLEGVGADFRRRRFDPFAMHRNANLMAQGLQLFDGRRAICVGSHQQRLAAFFAQAQRQLGGGRCLARSLQTDQHDDVRRLLAHVELARFAQGRHQLFVDDFDHLLGGAELAMDLNAHCPIAHPLDKVFDNFIVDVGL